MPVISTAPSTNQRNCSKFVIDFFVF
uniref:Uncharacterized protein n=1 Tax=Arundo donax TaxID=35708 RepID=A0A0A8XUP8_ARUDO